MRDWIRSVSLSFVLVVAAASATAQKAPLKITEDKPGLLKLAKVAPADAQKTAQAKFPAGTILSGEIERERGKLIYSFDIQLKGVKGVEEVNVDAMTGAIVGIEHENPKAEARQKAADKKPETGGRGLS